MFKYASSAAGLADSPRTTDFRLSLLVSSLGVGDIGRGGAGISWRRVEGNDGLAIAELLDALLLVFLALRRDADRRQASRGALELLRQIRRLGRQICQLELPSSLLFLLLQVLARGDLPLLREEQVGVLLLIFAAIPIALLLLRGVDNAQRDALDGDVGGSELRLGGDDLLGHLQILLRPKLAKELLLLLLLQLLCHVPKRGHVRRELPLMRRLG
mmetsp:Transcript_69570/g.145338  ORF Transcript_69570/g.145338 Transcript_69570/m.145338 type:complete len:215 (-) Transcript_69570:69-713(-)